ncbi:MAG: RluA family pseudouridine synthase [Bacteroidota bacterium]
MASPIPTLSIVFENKHWLAVNKIPKLSVERSPYGEPTIESLVFDYLSQSYRNPYVGIVHRLDRVTTGLLLFAKRKSTLRKLNEQFRNRTIKKTYLAITEKAPQKPSATLQNFLAKNRTERKGIVCPTNIKGSFKSMLHYEWLGKNTFGHLLKVRPETGKFHQIRVQLAHIGCPILGDEKYGATQELSPNEIALHAWQLELTNPTTEQPIQLQASLPPKNWWNGFEEFFNSTSTKDNDKITE